MARVSIYVPDDLKVRMDRAGDLNWSAAAQRAFEVELNLTEWKMVENATEQVAARLRASKVQEDDSARNAGRKAGQEWARTNAEFGELKRIATYQHWNEIPEESYASTLASLIENVKFEDLDQVDLDVLWEELGATAPFTYAGGGGNVPPPDPAWIDGFVEGATEVWNEVADQV